MKGVTRMKTKLSIFTLLLFVPFLAGCGGGSKYSLEDKPIPDVKIEAKQMISFQLKKIIAEYNKAIESKEGEKVGANKEDKAKITKSINALKKRLNIYDIQFGAQKKKKSK